MGYYDDRDGRRKSDPLRSINSSPTLAPDWQLYRVVSAQDSVFTEKKYGINCGHYKKVRFSVVPFDDDPVQNPDAAPGGSANPSIEVMIWSDSAGEFLAFPTPLTKTGAGAGVAYIVDVENAYGSILFVAITAAPGGVVAISAQGYSIDHTL